MGNVLLLLRLGITITVTGCGKDEAFGYFHFIEVTKTISGVIKALGCVYLRWGT